MVTAAKYKCNTTVKIIDGSSRNVEPKQHAQANNASNTISPKAVFASCQRNGTKPHGFSKTVAEMKKGRKKLGWSAAVVLRYLGYMLGKQGEEYEGKQWVRINLDHIASQYPYLSRAGVDKTIQRLISFAACAKKNLNVEFGRSKIDRTRWFHVPKQWMNAAEEDLRYFFAPLAGIIGVPAAVIHYNFIYWIGKMQEAKEEAVVSLTPEKQAALQTFAKATIKRAIKRLVDVSLIFTVPENQCLYASEPIIPSGSKVDESGSKVDMPGSKVDMVGSKVDDNSCCSYFVDSLEECSKTEPAALFHGSPPVVGEQKKASDIVHQQRVDTTPEEQQRKETDNEVGSSDKSSSFISRDEWHKRNQDIAPVVARIRDSGSKFSDDVVNAVQGVAAKFLGHLDIQLVERLCDEATEEEIYDTLAPSYLAFFPKLGLSLTPQVFEIVHYGAFESVLGAFWQHEYRQTYSHPIHLFIRVSYSLFLDLWKHSEQRRLASVEKEFEERAKELASPDQHFEHCDDLSPAQKTRVFKQGLHSRNKIGGIHFDQVLRTNEINLSAAGFRSITGLFTINPELTAAHLLAVMDGCLKLHRSKPAPKEFKRGVQWHARTGHNLTTFGRYLRTIVKQLGVFEACPVKVWPGGADAEDDDDELMAA